MSSSSDSWFFRCPKHDGILFMKEGGRDVDQLLLKVTNAVKEPIRIQFNQTTVQINTFTVSFNTLDSEILFLQDLYFALEEINDVGDEHRITSRDRVIDLETLIKQAQGEHKNG